MCSYPHAEQQSCPAVSGCFSSEPSRAKAWRRSGRRLISRWVALQAQENFSVWKKCFFSFLDKIKILAFHLLLNVRQNKIRLLCSLVPGCQMNWFHQSFEFSEKMGEDQCNLKHLEMTVKKQMGFFFKWTDMCQLLSHDVHSYEMHILWPTVHHITFKKRVVPDQAWNEAAIWHSHDTVSLLDLRSINGDTQCGAILF